MFFTDLMFVILFTAIFAALLGGSYRRRGTGYFGFFLIILLLGTLAIGGQANPIGPLFWGVSWLSFLLVGLFISLLLAALAAMYPEPTSKQESESIEVETATGSAFNIFFWILFVILIIIIIASYV